MRPNAVHGPLDKLAPSKYLGRFDTGLRRIDNFYAYLNANDEGVGRIPATLKAQSQFDNTLLFVLSDNSASGGGGTVSFRAGRSLIIRLFPWTYTTANSHQERRRRSSAIGRGLRLLRAHHLIRKVPGAHRYHLTSRGRQIASAVIAAADATLNLLIPKAA